MAGLSTIVNDPDSEKKRYSGATFHDLRHATVTTTLGVYRHLSPGTDERVDELLETTFVGAAVTARSFRGLLADSPGPDANQRGPRPPLTCNPCTVSPVGDGRFERPTPSVSRKCSNP